MDIAERRLRQQFLVGTRCTRPEKVVESLLAVQSQDYSGAKWAVAQRTRAGEVAAVEDAFRDGRILRTHAMRPTWHFVTREDIHWLLELTSPRVHAVNALYYRRNGIDAATVKRSRARIEKALSRGEHLTRDELARAIEPRDATMTGERLAYLVMHAELDALICSGAMRGKQHTYAFLEERAPEGKNSVAMKPSLSSPDATCAAMVRPKRGTSRGGPVSRLPTHSAGSRRARTN